VLLKTANSALSTTAPFNPKFVFLHISGAEYLRERGLCLILLRTACLPS
jgi:hypothetical protein